jgi:hypothetical protein
MMPDPKRPDVLLSVTNEIEAAAIVTALADYNIKAITVGGYISGFKAEAPGNIAVVVTREDFDRAKEALTEIQQQQGSIDWSKVDVMETLETPEDSDAMQSSNGGPTVILSRLWWLLEVVGIATCLIVWLFTRELKPGLIYAATALALAGMFMALFPFASRYR